MIAKEKVKNNVFCEFRATIGLPGCIHANYFQVNGKIFLRTLTGYPNTSDSGQRIPKAFQGSLKMLQTCLVPILQDVFHQAQAHHDKINIKNGISF